jgi:hypothetical protein
MESIRTPRQIVFFAFVLLINLLVPNDSKNFLHHHPRKNYNPNRVAANVTRAPETIPLEGF